ncbi:MAG TPA: Uma2 family endonuclease [Thermoanaerobaculia bacterium]|jgi:Uma2 family endonuclease|nr:Uma2 family endonuclease [Thermoanaerobaculia bacterium]
MSISHPNHAPWTREEYERTVEAGSFQPGDRFELVEGVVYDMAPQNSRHATAVRLLQKALDAVFGAGFDVRCQLPLALGADSEPEPDFAVVSGDPRDYRDSHPTRAVLAVEIADSSAFHDRVRKGRLYARSGIPEYWILNLIDGVLEVYREPGEDSYRSRVILRPSETISPLARSQAAITVGDLIP